MPPLFITFEGLDGSGKSTHLRRASEWLARREIPHLVTHEPGGTPLGDALRAIFLDHRWGAGDGGGARRGAPPRAPSSPPTVGERSTACPGCSSSPPAGASP